MAATHPDPRRCPRDVFREHFPASGLSGVLTFPVSADAALGVRLC